MLKVWASLFLLFSSTCFAGLDLSNPSKVLKRYEKYHKRFSKKVCRPGTEEKFNKLYQDYLSFGFYIPTLKSGKVDVDTIRENLSLVKDKIRFIQSNIHFLKNNYSYEKANEILNRIQLDLKDVARKKTELRFKNSDKTKKASRDAIGTLGRHYIELLDSAPFLLSFMFPVDYFELRSQYDDPDNRKKLPLKNKIYFIRKIVEDGAQEKNVGRNDKFFRALVSTVYLRLKNQGDFIDDELYYDMSDLVSGFKKQLKYGKEKLISRQQEWLERTAKILDFYKDIVRNYKKSPKKMDDYLSKKKLALQRLRDYVHRKQAETYYFWRLRPETYRALFSVETILMNEVGRLDVDGSLERREVTRVVAKRTGMKEYTIPSDSSLLYKEIRKKLKNKYTEYPWLNVLFKEGEFSFTYYFLHASVRTFCPEMTFAGRSLRKENVNIGIETLKDFKDTDSIRYFSRASMLGRISMHKIWERFIAISEKPGLPVKNGKYLLERVRRKEFYWLYDFRFEDDKFWAIEIDKKRYIFEEGADQFYKYRNPYYFTYFKEKTLN